MLLTNLHDLVKLKNSMRNLILNRVLDKWKTYMVSKTERRIIFARKHHRNDTVWKKMIRDVRDFFRIVFKFRFEGFEITDSSTAFKLISIMFEELGFDLTHDEARDPLIFKFLTQYHSHTISKMFKSVKISDTYDSVFKVMDRHNEENLTVFMQNRLASQLFYFVYSNFLEFYVPHISRNYRKDLTTLI